MKIGDIVLESKGRGYGIEWTIVSKNTKGDFKCIRYIRKSDLQLKKSLAKALGKSELYTEKYCKSLIDHSIEKEIIKLKRTFKMSEVEKSEDLKNSYLALAAKGVMELII